MISDSEIRIWEFDFAQMRKACPAKSGRQDKTKTRNKRKPKQFLMTKICKLQTSFLRISVFWISRFEIYLPLSLFRISCFEFRIFEAKATRSEGFKTDAAKPNGD